MINPKYVMQANGAQGQHLMILLDETEDPTNEAFTKGTQLVKAGFHNFNIIEIANKSIFKRFQIITEFKMMT